MQIGVIGLGRMGGNIARRLTGAGHDVVMYDRDGTAVSARPPWAPSGPRASTSSCAGCPRRAPYG